MIGRATINQKLNGGEGKRKKNEESISSILDRSKSRASIVSSIRRGTRKDKAKISRRSFGIDDLTSAADLRPEQRTGLKASGCVAVWPPQTIHCPRWGPRVSNPIRDGKSRWIGRSIDFSPRPLHNGGGSPQSSGEGSKRSIRSERSRRIEEEFFMHPSNFKREGTF